MQIGWGMPAWSAEMDGGGGKMETRIAGSLLPLPFIDAAYGVSKRGSEFGEYYYEGGIEKKRRLSVEQVRSLELSFERENKLEPEKKLQLAQKLGLEPRQVSVWFQNRRARSKSKRLELSFDSLKANYDSVSAEVDKLRFEVARLNALLRAKNDDDSATGKPPVMTTAVLEELSFTPIATDMAEIEQGSPLGTATSDYSATNQWFPCGSTLLDEHHNNTSPSDVTDCAAAVATVYDVASSPDIRADENSPCRSNSTGYNNTAFAQDSFSEFLSNELWLW